MREKIPDEVADLIYLDPPFNSQRNYNLLFKQVKGDTSPAQIMAFEDTWQWSKKLYDDFFEDRRNAKLFDLVKSLYQILGDSEMMAYVLMMAPRLLELHNKLKPTGSLYLHCDPVASHYLKIILDVVFGASNFRNEVVWKRSHAHNSAKRYGPIHDVILFYTRGNDYRWNDIRLPYDEAYVDKFFKFDDGDGRGRYWTADITGSGVRHGETGKPWRGFDPTPKQRHWQYPHARLEELDRDNRIYWPKTSGAWPKLKRYLAEAKGVPLQDLILDVYGLSQMGAGKESRGYPTQKPLALLERIIGASSCEGDIVFDPFCGCGTAVVAAERMKRKWIGIDITYLAIAEIKYRLSTETEAKEGVSYKVVGSPTDEYGARKFFEETKPQSHKPFEMWAVSLVEGEPREKKGSDKGIDGVVHLLNIKGGPEKAVIQVKGGGVNPSSIRDFAHVINREGAVFGLFMCFTATKEMLKEAEKVGFAATPGRRKIPRLQILTFKELLDERKQFTIPEGYRLPKYTGVGKAAVRQSAMDFLSDE
jgi:DNA modification methylase